MKVESKRIFISDLPDAATEKDIEQKFGLFGQVTSIEIKQRKDIGPKNKTQQFAFININIDDRQLKNCFDDFASKKWKGSYVEIQLAKESFLDRLKRERELAKANGTAVKQDVVTEKPVEPIKKTPINGEKKIVKKDESSESSEDSSSEEEEEKVVEKPVVKRVVNVEIIKPEEDVYEDIVVKNNKFKKFNNKIEGFGKEPVVVIEKKKKTMDPSRQAADKKRINSMLEMKRSYNKQKSVIKTALSKIDVDANNATKLTENDSKGVKRKAENSTDKKSLFDEDDENEEEIQLELKEQFQGKKGQQLFELQSKYKNDKRFQMDSRFAEEEEEECLEKVEDEEISREEESRKQLEILGEVLGKKITPRQPNTEKAMLRFDPSQPDHTKYEIKEQEKKKRKKNKEIEEKTVVLPEVSTEKFYQVTDNLKQSLQEKQSFSLLNMFGRNTDVEDDKEEEKDEVVEESGKVIKKVKGGKEKNPFRYDSTDDEEEERVPKKIELIGEKKEEESKEEAQKVRLGPAKIWSEPFFFKKDDYRFQEGITFMRKLQTSRSDLLTQRKEVREIVKYRMNRNIKKQSKTKYKSGQRKLSNRMKRK